MKDVFGRVIEPGNIIAYATTAGRSADLRFYKVVELTKTGNSLRCRRFSAYMRKLPDADGFAESTVILGDGSRAMVIPPDYLDHLK